MRNSFLVIAVLWASGTFASPNDPNLYVDFKSLMDRSFQTNGIARKERIYQLDFQKLCSIPQEPSDKIKRKIEAEQLKTIRYPADGQYFGDWREGEKIALNGRGLTWIDPTRFNNGGGCYNCHQLSHHEISYGTIGPSLQEYGKLRGTGEDMVRYTWGKIYNAKAYNACSHMPRNGDAEILTEQQIRHLMAFLFDPDSPVNKK